jgi:hypothetical protein
VRLIGQPAAVARDADRIDVLAAGDDGAIWHRWWNGAEWVAWQRIGSAPAGVSAVAADWVGSRLDVYARDRDRGLWYLAITE